VLPFITAVVSAVFAIVVAMRSKGRPALVMWAIGFAMFALAALAGALARSGTEPETMYRVFYLFGGILNVTWLGLGTMFLLAPRAGRVSLIAVVLFSLVAAYATFTTPVNLQVALDSGRGYPDGSLPRILAGIGSGLGSVVLIGGALWSGWIFLRRRHNGKRALANAIIAVGVLIVAAGGTVTFTGANGILETTNLVGLVVMFGGFLLA
jgi:hypothetical protein